jgi:hypothetical protein
MITITEEWPNKMKRDKATKKWLGDHSPRIHETSTTWKILNLTRTADQTQEEDSHPGEGEEEEEEDPRDSRITIQETRTSIAVSWKRT